MCYGFVLKVKVGMRWMVVDECCDVYLYLFVNFVLLFFCICLGNYVLYCIVSGFFRNWERWKMIYSMNVCVLD